MVEGRSQPLVRRLARVRRRLIALAALDGAVTGAALAAGAAALAVAFWRLRGQSHGTAPVAAVVLAGALAGGVARALRPVSLSDCARRVDRVLGGEDRVLSALWLTDAPGSLARAAVADALARTASLAPSAPAPARRPTGLGGLAAAAVALAVALLMPAGTRAARRIEQHAAPTPARPLPPGALELERAAAAATRTDAERSGDARARQLAAELDGIVRGLMTGTVGESAALESLRALEDQARREAAGAARDGQAGRAAAGALAASSATRAAAEALRRPAGQSEATAAALAGSAAAQPTATAAAMRAASAGVSAAAQDQSADGAPERRRLSRDDPGGSSDQTGATGARDQGEQRHLERLSRDLDEAAAGCAAGDPGCRTRAEQQGRALGELQRRAAGEPSLRQVERASRQLHDRIARGELRGSESRASRAFAQAAAGGGEPPAGSEGTPGESANSGEPGQAEGTQPGQPGGGRSSSAQAAGGEASSAQPSGATGELEAAGAAPSEGQASAGTGIGHENGGAPLGARESAPAPAGRDANVSLADGAGASRAEVIDGAAGRGFASRPYARVYADYRAAVEDALGATGVPPGQQYLVRRYFELIRPRAGAGGRP